MDSPLDCKESKPVNPKGNQSWIFSGGTDPGAEAPILWLPKVKSRLIGKDPDARKDRRQEEKGMTKDGMVGWHHRLNGHEFEQVLGDGEDREAWRAAVHGVTKSRTQLSNWTTTALLWVGALDEIQPIYCYSRVSFRMKAVSPALNWAWELK